MLILFLILINNVLLGCQQVPGVLEQDSDIEIISEDVEEIVESIDEELEKEFDDDLDEDLHIFLILNLHVKLMCGIPKKNQWVEVAGAGIFRPEVVKPLIGLDVPVLAWGIGLERTIMEYYNITDIRDVYKNDLNQLRESKIWIK